MDTGMLTPLRDHLGAVACGHPETCAAAATALRMGGNAFDAAVAAGFAASVVEPGLTSLGGGGFLLAVTGDGERVLFDFFVDTPGRGLPEAALEPHFHPVTVHVPGSDQVFNVGYGSAATPGVLPGLLHVHARLGRLGLSDVVAPAARLATDGVALNEGQAYVLRLLNPILTQTEAGRHLYMPQAQEPQPGDVFRNPDLGRFLSDLAGGRVSGYHTGDLAAQIEIGMREGRGLLTAADLAAYEVIEREPLTFSFRGRTVLTNPAPSFGGPLIALQAELYERRVPHPPPYRSGAMLTSLAEVLVDVDRHRDTGGAGPVFSRGTTHVSVADRDGNVAAMTTSNGEGSGFLVPGTGIMLNNMMGEDDLHPRGFHSAPAGERVGSMMSPTIVLGPDGTHAELALGSGGSKRIRTVVFQVLRNVLDYDLGLQEAVDAPRLHWDGTTVQMEPGMPRDAVEVLADTLPTHVWDVKDLYFGGVHAVSSRGDTGADPRRWGAAMLIARG
ncbi:MAG: gamma-glutamyltransferase [Acidimicrobiia bacterium]|nr:gamma-glutamyltransferase [Acidimicrobiia bacterium]